jgi:hypothetical protein
MRTLSFRLGAALLGLALTSAPSLAQDTVFPPFGNLSGGAAYDVRAAASEQPMRLLVQHNGLLPLGLQFDWCGRDMTTSTSLSPKIGLNYSQQGVTTDVVTFTPGDFLRRVDVWATATRINQIRVYTSTTSYDFGSRVTGDARHNFPAPAGEQIVGFVGNTNNSSLFSLGVVTRPLLASDQRFGTGCTTARGTLSLRWRDAWGGITIGQTPILECTAVPNGASCFFLYGFSDTVHAGVPLPYNLAPYGSPTCNVFTSIDFFVLAGYPSASGVTAHTIDATYWSTNFVGMNLFLQVMILNSNGLLKTSDAYKTVIGLL